QVANDWIGPRTRVQPFVGEVKQLACVVYPPGSHIAQRADNRHVRSTLSGPLTQAEENFGIVAGQITSAQIKIQKTSAEVRVRKSRSNAGDIGEGFDCFLVSSKFVIPVAEIYVGVGKIRVEFHRF